MERVLQARASRRVRIPANPSLLPRCGELLLTLARRHTGYTFTVRLVRLGDLVPLRWLRGRGRVVRLVIEAEPPARYAAAR